MAGVMAFIMLLSLILSLIPTNVHAASSSEIKKQIAELKNQKKELESQMKDVKNQVKENDNEISSMVAQKNAIDQEISLLNEQIINTNEQIAVYSQLIADTQDELDIAQFTLNGLNEKHKLRIRAMEERGKLSYWNILFRATSVTDLLDRVNMIQQIAEADQRSLEDLRRTSAVVLAMKEEVERNRAALEANRQQLDQAVQLMEEKRTEADRLLLGLAAKGAEYEALLLKSEEKQDQLLLQLAQKKSTYNRQAYEQWLQNNQEGDAPAYYDDQWLSPLESYRLTSVFGMRFHPVLKRNRMHNGIDMAAPANTPIYAARGGLVITAAYQKDGAGNYVQLDHGDGFRSIYMHMTRYVVAEGDYVAPGQVIGYVGTTGLSTGNHLHFGISLDGTYVNPLEYIPN